MKEYLEKLNKEQLAAATETEGPVLVLAGAGSGKTRVLTSRIAYILDNQLCDSSQILAITFTNKAANEMKSRLYEYCGDTIDRMWISTIHSMCLRILRNSIAKLKYYNKNFTVYSEVESERVLKRIIAEKGYEGESVLKNAKYHISFAKTNDIAPDRYLIEGSGNDLSKYVAIFKEYQMALHMANAMDFDDLILETYHLLEEDLEVLNYYANKFHYILIDEFQDTNILQYKIAKLLSSVHGNIFAVGDDDQSIYSWRGAEIRNILDFNKDFKKAKVFKLEQNYRSTGKILKLANAIIAKNNVRSPKKLWTNNDDGVKIEYFCGDEESNESRYVVNQINALANRGAKYSNFAILMRVNALSRSFEQELMRNSIPFKVFGGFKFFERKEIKDLTAYLRIIANPLDNDAFLRIINTPRRGIGDKTIKELTFYATENDCSLFDTLCNVEIINLPSGAKNKLLEFRQILFDLTILSSVKPINEVVEQIIERTRFLDQFINDTEENIAKRMNVDEFLSSVQDFVKTNKNASLENYLSSITLYSDIDEADNSDYVTVATIHAVKGLEFDTVFIVGCDESIFPISRASASPADLEEERRLMYVAVTRAEKRLYLTRANSRYLYGTRQFTQISRFLNDVSDQIGLDTMPQRRRYIDDLLDGNQSKYPKTGSFEKKRDYYNSQEYELGYDQDVPTSGGMSSYVSNFARNKTPQKNQNSSQNPSQYRPGRMVNHKKFGIGKILTVRQSGDNIIIDVVFQSCGVKSLSVAFAPIELL